jgi:hypothetical protein
MGAGIAKWSNCNNLKLRRDEQILALVCGLFGDANRWVSKKHGIVGRAPCTML